MAEEQLHYTALQALIKIVSKLETAFLEGSSSDVSLSAILNTRPAEIFWWFWFQTPFIFSMLKMPIFNGLVAHLNGV